MGERYYLTGKKCQYCEKVQEEVYFAPTSNITGFNCEKCDKENFITEDFHVMRLEDVSFVEVYRILLSTSNLMSNNQIRKMAMDMFKELKERCK